MAWDIRHQTTVSKVGAGLPCIVGLREGPPQLSPEGVRVRRSSGWGTLLCAQPKALKRRWHHTAHTASPGEGCLVEKVTDKCVAACIHSPLHCPWCTVN